MEKPASKLRILFVCLGNICRSPAGENVFRALVAREGVDPAFEIDSAGTIDLHAGDPPDARMRKAASRRGLTLQGHARGIVVEDLHHFDLILCMDEDNQREVMALRDQLKDEIRSSALAEVRLFCEFCRHHEARVVPDPYYGGEQGFERVLDLLEDGCETLLKEWRRGGLQPTRTER